MSIRLRLLAVLALAVPLSSCGGIPEGKPVAQQQRPNFSKPDARLCLAKLKTGAIKFASLPDQNFSGGCRTIDTIKLLDFGTPATNLGAMTCPLASNFAAWAKHAVAPAGLAYFGSQVVKIETMGTYSCRNVNGASSGKLSEHAFGNAVDVSGFVLANGRRISITEGWNGRSDEKAFLRRLRDSACKRFGTVLSPDYNAVHYNHLHFDMGKTMQNGSTYCR